MKVIVTAYIDHTVARLIDREAKLLEVSRSEYTAAVLADEVSRKRARQRIKQEHKELVAA